MGRPRPIRSITRVLGPDDDLPHRPRRILVAGVSGVGKTTVAPRVAEVTGSPRTELDAVHHGPGWTPRPSFTADVAALAVGDAWVTEWQYGSVRDLLAARADLLVWLDLPFWTTTFPRVVRRTLRRRRRREELWNGNVEPPLRTILTDREHVVRWSVGTRHKYAELVPAADDRHLDLVVVRLCADPEVECWLGGALSRAVRPF